MTVGFEVVDGRVVFSGVGSAFLRFASCVRRAVDGDGVRNERRGAVSVDRNCLHLIRECLVAHLVPLDRFADDFANAERHRAAREKAMDIIGRGDGAGLPAPWDSTLKDYQKIAVKAMTVTGLRGLCLFDEQGTGKTLMTLSAFDILKEKGEVDAAFVVAPKSVINSWRQEFIARCLADKYEMKIAEGGASEKAKVARGRADILVMNYESMASLDVWLRAVAKRGKCMMVVDEAFFVKNKDARRSKIARGIRRLCTKGFVLSGTPAPRAPADVINQVNIADDGYAFRGRDDTTGDRGMDAEVVTEALENRAVYVRRLKSEVAPYLPPKKFDIVRVQMEYHQRKLYDDARDEMVLSLREMDNTIFKKDITNYLARRQTLLQICGCPGAIDKMHAADHAKLPVLDALLADLIEKRGKKAVVWTCYKQSVSELKERYARYGVVVIDGSVSDDERAEAIKSFQESDNVRIFLGNPAAAGAGITLHAAADAFYITYPGQAAHFLQSLDRIHRIGQNAPEVRYHFLVCERTVEVNQIRLLKEKALMQHRIFAEGEEWPASLEEALSELEND